MKDKIETQEKNLEIALKLGIINWTDFFEKTNELNEEKEKKKCQNDQ